MSASLEGEDAVDGGAQNQAGAGRGEYGSPRPAAMASVRLPHRRATDSQASATG
jgi:hypothetical protein